MESLGLEMKPGGDWRPWFYDASRGAPQNLILNKAPYWGEMLSYKGMGPQLGGYVKNFDKNLTFVTVHTSGHMVRCANQMMPPLKRTERILFSVVP